jgi:hypothetical protein
MQPQTPKRLPLKFEWYSQSNRTYRLGVAGCYPKRAASGPGFWAMGLKVMEDMITKLDTLEA